MRYFSDVVDDKYGNIQSGVSITVKLNGVNASIWSDSGGVNPTNPVTSDTNGIISFYYNQSGTYTFWKGASQVGSVDLQDLSETTGAAKVGSDDGASGSLWTTVAGFISKSTSSTLMGWALSQCFELVSATRNANEIVTSASIIWPDGATGTYAADTINSTFNAVDAWHATHVIGGVTKTITQPAVTRDASGAVIAQPAITIT